MAATVWSMFAVEAALRARFDADRKVELRNLVKSTQREGLLPATGWEDDRLDAARKLRNRVIHGQQHPALTPGMAGPMVAASHEVVASLFPDRPLAQTELNR